MKPPQSPHSSSLWVFALSLRVLFRTLPPAPISHLGTKLFSTVLVLLALGSSQSCHIFTIFSGHTVVQVRLIFRVLRTDSFLAYVQRFNHTSPPPTCSTTEGAAGLHVLKRVVRNNGSRVGEIIPLRHLRSPVHVIPCFGREANPRLTRHTVYELSNEFWLNKYWNKEIFYALSQTT